MAYILPLDKNKIIFRSLTSIQKLRDKGICSKCYHCINIMDDRVPESFKCFKFFELIEFPKTINGIYINKEEDEDLKCYSFVEK